MNHRVPARVGLTDLIATAIIVLAVAPAVALLLFLSVIRFSG